jgi:hypothetical protein
LYERVKKLALHELVMNRQDEDTSVREEPPSLESVRRQERQERFFSFLAKNQSSHKYATPKD